MARLFTAIELERDLRAEVTRVQADATRLLHDPGFRIVPASQLHLTLVFLGEVAEPRVTSVRDAMSRDLPAVPFTLSFEGWGVFPPRGAARVLWLGVEQGRDALQALFDMVSARLADAGVPGERRAFTPHLTLGRWRNSSRSPRPHLPATGPVGAQRVTAVTLFQSRLLPRGAEHVAVTRAALAGAGHALH